MVKNYNLPSKFLKMVTNVEKKLRLKTMFLSGRKIVIEYSEIHSIYHQKFLKLDSSIEFKDNFAIVTKNRK